MVLSGEGTPIDDQRASAAYRSAMLGNALRKLWARVMTVTTDPTTPLATRPPGAVVGVEMEHESAALHVTGHALYTDDLVGRTGRRPARAPGAGAAHPRAGHRPARGPGVRRPRRGPGAHRRRRAGDQRRRRQARRAALPRRGDVPRPPGRLGARRDARGRPSRRGGGRGRLRAAAVAGHGDRGDRGRQLPGLLAGRRARRRRRRARLRGARLRGRHRDGRPGALLPRDARVPRAGRRGRPGLRAVQHPAPDRDPGDRRPRARPAEQRGDRAVPADGGRLRGQGDAAARLRRDRRARQHPHRPPGAAAPDPHPGHHHDRQATRLPRHVARGLRRRRSAAGAGGHAHLRRRLEPRPVGAGAGPGAVPRRQRLLDPARPRARSDREDPQDVADGLPGLRRPPGDAGGRGRPGSVRTPARARPGRAAAAQLLRRGPGHAVRPAGAARRADWSPRGTRSPRPATSRRGVPRSPPSTTPTRTPSARWP